MTSINDTVAPRAPPAGEKAEKRRWSHWYHPNDTPAERKLILKMDLLLVPYGFITFWMRYIDHTNATTTYVSGLKEELRLEKDDLSQMVVIIFAGSVVSQLLFMYFYTKVSMGYFIPCIDLLWGAITLVQYRVTSYDQLLACRFLVGFFDGASTPGLLYVFGSWYRGDEIARRSGLLYLGLIFGQLTSPLIQSGVSKNLEGVHGLSGWRWMFIICGAMTLFHGSVGIFLFPGTPEKTRTWFLSKQELELARTRLTRAGHAEPKSFSWAIFKRVLTSPRVYLFMAFSIFFFNSSTTVGGAYVLWLKSLNRYSIPELNHRAAIPPALGMLYNLLVSTGADLSGSPAGAISVAYAFGTASAMILAIWYVPEGAKWVAFTLSTFVNSAAGVVFGWVNHSTRHSAEERSIAIAIIHLVGQSTVAWIPLLTFPTSQGPRFLTGYVWATVCGVLATVTAWAVRAVINREEKRHRSTLAEESSTMDGSCLMAQCSGEEAILQQKDECEVNASFKTSKGVS